MSLHDALSDVHDVSANRGRSRLRRTILVLLVVGLGIAVSGVFERERSYAGAGALEGVEFTAPRTVRSGNAVEVRAILPPEVLSGLGEANGKLTFCVDAEIVDALEHVSVSPLPVDIHNCPGGIGYVVRGDAISEDGEVVLSGGTTPEAPLHIEGSLSIFAGPPTESADVEGIKPSAQSDVSMWRLP